MNNSHFYDSSLNIAIILGVLSIALFLNTLNNEFTYDDAQVVKNSSLISENANIYDLLHESRMVRTISLMLDRKLFGLNPNGYHIQNIFWHGLASVLLYFFVLRLSNNKHIAILSSILFVSHPIHVEAVANVSHRKELLCLAFSLSTFLLFLKSYEFGGYKRTGIIALAFIFYVLALLSKQVAATIPLMIFFYEIYFIPRNNKRFLHDNLKYLLPFIILFFFIYGVYYIKPAIDSFFINKTVWHNITYTEYLLTVTKTILFYIKILFWPVNMSPHHVFAVSKSILEPTFLLALLTWLLLALSIILLRIRSPLVSFGMLWFVVNLTPVMIIPGTAHIVAERYLYIPSVGFVIAFSVIVANIWKYRPSVINISLIIIIGLYSLNSLNRNTIWKNEYTLWSDTIIKEPDSWLAHNNLGNEYLKMKRFDNALQHNQIALRLRPDDPIIYNNLGNIYADQEKPAEAINAYRTSLRLNPDYPDAYVNLGVLYRRIGKFDESIAAYKTAIKLNPAYFEAHNNLGTVYFNKGMIDEAFQEFQIALKLRPDYENAYYNLGIAYGIQGRFREAADQFNNAIRLNPNYAEAHNSLSLAYLKMGEIDLAISEYTATLELRPNSVEAHYNLGVAYMEKGLKDRAKVEFETTLKLQGDHLQARKAFDSLIK